ncbi:low molecular weight protein-tyrosine-phosphatase [Penaeicola halotolerans]|uniref:low molecular weight protein-tyrosine-phosphatase n=1 Tax=Penaeicola halotolerans TaxID=2793196 RepID=UPI001CF8F7BF|nr:low molecular weight protein-tyrosine-phosphatase [Penaeicola halotolerans]
MRVLFVCLGNICRSPLAEALFQKKIMDAGLSDKVKCDSCGVSDYHIGELPDDRTLANAKMNGVEIKHRARQLNKRDFKSFDYILAMDKSNLSEINKFMQMHHIAHDNVHLLRSFDQTEGQEVPDPYYGGDEGFQKVFDILSDAVDSFLVFLKEEKLAEADAR